MNIDKFLKKKETPEQEKEGKKHEALLVESLGDLDKELAKLKEEKGALEADLGQTQESLDSTETEEETLRYKISELVDQEAKHNTKKNYIEEKLTKLKTKLSKKAK